MTLFFKGGHYKFKVLQFMFLGECVHLYLRFLLTDTGRRSITGKSNLQLDAPQYQHGLCFSAGKKLYVNINY